MKKNNIIFLLMIGIFLCVGMFTLVRGEKEISYKENRYLQKFQHFTISGFLNGTYQNSLESALTDQFTGGETIKGIMNNIFNYFTIPKSGSLCENKYFRFGDYYTYNCDNYFIMKNVEYTEELKSKLNSRVEMYSKLNDYVDTYYYFVSNSNIFNFEENEYSVPILDVLKTMTGKYHLSSLSFNSYEEYKKYFYSTDHHWNYQGSYQGYKDIMKMLDPNATLLTPKEEVTFAFDFLGSSARILDFSEFKDKFTVYKFDIPPHTDYINELEDSYGTQDEYFEGTYFTDLYTNHYSEFYGWDYAEVIFDFNNVNLDNLLILSNSYSNPINELIASHFNKTFVIDLRHYEKHFGKKFNVKEYIKTNKIDKVLVLANYEYLNSDEFNLEMGE